MKQSSVSRSKRKSEKPEKPYPGFPLYSHATKRWAKRIRGKIHYFGPWNNPEAALEKFNHEWPYLSEGRTPPPVREDGLTVADLCNHFLTAKKESVQIGELAQSTFKNYFGVCKQIIVVLGRERLVEDLRVEDFQKLRLSFAKTHGPLRLRMDVTFTKGVFKYGYEAELFEKPVRFGPQFTSPPQKILRQNRINGGKRMFEADELRKIIDTATLPLRAMILLGINCGYGNTDCANLSKADIDFERGFINFPRLKTAVQRSCFIWPETAEALLDAIKKRPTPDDPDLEGLVFLTAAGNQYVRDTKGGVHIDSVKDQFGRFLKQLKMKRKGLSFYALRHSFQTAAEECKDFPAIKHVMGHSDPSMSAVYRERISDERLKAVTDTVREWLWGT